MKKFLTVGLLLLATSLFANNNIAKVTASAHDKDHKPENSVDGDVGTRWANNVSSWVLYEFKAPKEIKEIEIMPFKGDERKQKFDMEVSMDGTTWIPALGETITSGKTKNFETFNFTPVQAKFVKLNMNGTDVNKWSGIIEVNFK